MSKKRLKYLIGSFLVIFAAMSLEQVSQSMMSKEDGDSIFIKSFYIVLAISTYHLIAFDIAKYNSKFSKFLIWLIVGIITIASFFAGGWLGFSVVGGLLVLYTSMIIPYIRKELIG